MLNSVTIFGQSIKSFRKNQTLDVLYYRSFHFFPLVLLDIGMQKSKYYLISFLVGSLMSTPIAKILS